MAKRRLRLPREAAAALNRGFVQELCKVCSARASFEKAHRDPATMIRAPLAVCIADTSTVDPPAAPVLAASPALAAAAGGGCFAIVRQAPPVRGFTRRLRGSA